MVKRKTTKRIRTNKEYESVLSSDEECFDEPSTKPTGKQSNDGYSSDDLLSEEEDHSISSSALKTDKLKLANYGEDLMGEMTEDDEEEVMAFSSDDSDDGDDNDISEDPLTSYYAMKAKKDEMESDLEDEEEDNIPSAEAWGKKKGLYYNTDFVDKDFRKFTQEDEELALAEEEEALQAQKRLLDEINDADIGFELYEKKSEDVEESETFEHHKKLEVDLSSLKSHEKRKLLQRTSPEIIPLINDFNRYLEVTRDLIEPILKMSQEPEYKILKKSLGYKFLELKYSLTMRYALNISFYMALKCNQIETKNHPITKTLLTYNKLITELEKAEKSTQLTREIKDIVDRLKRNEKMSFVIDEVSTKKLKAPAVPTIIKRAPTDDSKVKVAKKVKFMDNEDEEEDVNDEYNIPENSENENSDVEEDTSKRAITYQIAKNKGLTAKKKKELRNPRVKHRMKFKKAVSRRKGQVRPPRKEIHKYSGEASGIRSTVVKSVKFK